MFCHDVVAALPAVDRFVRRYAGSNYNEDLMSEIKVTALELGFEERGVKIESWLIEIAKIVCKANYYNKKRHPLLNSDFNPEQSNLTTYQPCRLTEDDYRRLINELPERQQNILKLTISGYKCREIAKILNLKPETVKATLWVARHKLKGREC